MTRRKFMSPPVFETLEDRRLLAGVTLITHGRLGHLWGFVDRAAEAIASRVGGDSNVAEYILKLTPDSGDGHLVPTISHVAGTGTPQSISSGEMIIKLDWTSVDSNIDYPLSLIASAVRDFWISTPVDGVVLASLPLHELSISRGTGLIDEIAKALGQSGVWVDQETYTDPNPIPANFDAPPTIYDNVAFVDNYWRTDGNPNDSATNGKPVDGAYNLNIFWLDGDDPGWALTHIATGGYYIGTIDLNSNDGGEGTIQNNWYSNTPTKPARNQTGFIYTRIVGADRPLSGVWSASGGSGNRTATGQSGAQWPNVTDLSVVGGSTTFTSGKTIQVQYLQEDRDSVSTATFYLDNDKNPFNSFASTLSSVNLSSTSDPASVQSSVSTNGASAGTFYLVAKVTDPDGRVRYAYSQQQVTINPPPPPPPPPFATIGSDRILRIIGTTGNDIIKVCKSGAAGMIKVTLNNSLLMFNSADFDQIYAYGGNGNDYIIIYERYGVITTPTRLDGGNGNDTIIGGSGKDTIYGDAGNDWLYGGADNDRLYGGAGSDHLVGGAGTDRQWGQGDNDFFVGAKKTELMDFTTGDKLV